MGLTKIPTRMRASAIDAFGQRPTVRDLPVPALKPGTVLVRVDHASVNPVDWKVMDGALSTLFPLDFPLISGIDAAGNVAAVAEDAEEFGVGDEVFGLFWGFPFGHGTFAEYALIPDKGTLHRIPPGLSHAHAAAMPTAGLTALAAMDFMGLSRGDSVLIIGATGGVGTMAIQPAAARGYEVLAMARPDARALVRILGAREALDYTNRGIDAEVRESHPDGVQGILDLHTERIADFRKILPLLAPGGIALKGTGEGFERPMEEEGRRFRNLEVNGGTQEMMDRFCGELESGSVHAVVGGRYPLNQVDRALERNRRGGARGKTVIEI